MEPDIRVDKDEKQKEMSKSHVARLFLLLGISFLYSAGGLPEDCPGPPPTRRYANPVVYKYHARNVEGRAEQTQRLVGVFPIHDADCTKVKYDAFFNTCCCHVSSELGQRSNSQALVDPPRVALHTLSTVDAFDASFLEHHIFYGLFP